MGDPCYDELLGSADRVASYRRALGVPGRHRLVVLSSTWGPTSLIGQGPGLAARVLAALPYDEFRVAAIVHPNVWSAERGRWLVSMDGSPARTSEGEPLGAATVIVQDVTVRPSAFGDRSGNNTPFTETVGSGTAHVLRDGRAYEARWTRTAADADTRFSTPDGERIDLAEGPLWIVYDAR
ncbi:hypothetical protein SCYAM73S_07147 [Streptomyces cyaneofuscatus]